MVLCRSLFSNSYFACIKGTKANETHWQLASIYWKECDIKEMFDFGVMNSRIDVWTFVMNNQGVADHHERWQHCAHYLTCFDQQACENSDCPMAGLFGQVKCPWNLSTSSMDFQKEYTFWFVKDLKEFCKTACVGCACSWWCVS